MKASPPHDAEGVIGLHPFKGKHRFQLQPYGTIQVATAPPYLIKGLIPRGGLTVVWGPPKCGKSFWAFDATMHIALGDPYRGRRVQQGSVVYLALEGGQGFRARVAAFRLIHRVNNADFSMITVRTDLIADHAVLVADIRAQQAAPALVVVDTLNRSLSGSENEPKDMAAYVRATDAIREAFGCAVLVIHHCGVDGTRPRGHTSLTGAADAQLNVKRDAANNIVLTVEWMKDGPEGDTIVSTLQVIDVGTDDDGDPISSCVVMAADAEYSEQQQRAIRGPAKVALDLLHRAIADAGTPRPGSNHIPESVTKVVSVEMWRSYCYSGTVTDSDKPEAKRQAFNRVAKKLQELKAIGIWTDFVWPVA